MVEDDSAMKDIADMNFAQRMHLLRGDGNSPEVIATANRVLEAMLQELQIVRDMRDGAARRYGVKLPDLPDPSPNPPNVPAPNVQPPTNNEHKGFKGFDGTLSGLIDRYLTDPASPFLKLRFHTRLYYTRMCKRLQKDYGTVAVNQINMTTIEDWHARWSVDSGGPMAKALITILRLVFSFGMTRLEDSECIRISLTLSKMKFKATKSRSVALNRDQALAICAEAHRLNLSSIALVQALQFETRLLNADIIGEWVPENEQGGNSQVIYSGQKWRRGLLWEEISADWVLRHPTITADGEIVEDLKNYPMVKAELDRLTTRKSSGPVIVNEHTGLPWTGHAFGKQWREIATAAGIPKNVRNADIRARNNPATLQPRKTRGKEKKDKRATEDLLSVARH